MTTRPDVWHVIPLNDLREHDPSEDCWCKPTLDDDGDDYVFLHHALDGRELYETGERKLQ